MLTDNDAVIRYSRRLEGEIDAAMAHPVEPEMNSVTHEG
jgi:hypothetical protein